MNAALFLRPTGALLAAALLCGVAACTREAEQQGTAAAPAPPIAANPDYMTAHVARDAALSDALIGTWSESFNDGGAPREQVTHYASDRTLSVAVTRSDKPNERTTGTGTWSIAQGFLTYQVTLAGSDKTLSGSDELLRIDKQQLVYVDGHDKKTAIAARVPDGAVAAVTTPPPPTVLAPTPSVAVAPSEDVPFGEEALFIASDDVAVHYVNVTQRAQLRLVVDIEEKVPVNVVFQRGKVAPEEYLMGLGVLALGQVVALFDDGKGEKVSTVNDLFNNRLSKRAAYRQFASPWVTLKEGPYTVILDNSGQLSPSRGDAPVRLRLYSRPVP